MMSLTDIAIRTPSQMPSPASSQTRKAYFYSYTQTALNTGGLSNASLMPAFSLNISTALSPASAFKYCSLYYQTSISAQSSRCTRCSLLTAPDLLSTSPP